MNHIGKTTEQLRRETVKEFYAANELRRNLQKELMAENPFTYHPYNTKSHLLREMKSWVRKLAYSCQTEKSSLSLDPYKNEPSSSAIAAFNFLRKKSSTRIIEKMMTLEETADVVREALLKGVDTVYVPKYWEDLIGKKGISFAHGSCEVTTRAGEKQKHYGWLTILNAREIKAEWINDDNMKAFKVVAFPETYVELAEAVTGYVVRSTLSNDVGNSFGIDIHKAVSLCKRRTKREVLKQMGV